MQLRRKTAALACGLVALLVVGAGASAASGHQAAKPKPRAKKAAPKFDRRYDCAKIAPGPLVNSLAGGFGGTYAARDHHVYASANGGSSACGYTQSAGYPRSATADAPAEVVIIYGKAPAARYHKGDYAAAAHNFGQSCAKMKAQGNPLPTDPRQCGPVAIPGLGDEAYEAGSYIDVLRGSICLTISIAPLPPGPGEYTMEYPSQDLLASMASAILARIP